MAFPRCNARPPARRRRVRPLHVWLYLITILREFWWTLASLAIVITVGATLYHLAPLRSTGQRPSAVTSLYAAWMAMLAQPLDSPPSEWYLLLVCALYPLVGFVLIGEGIVRLSLLMISRRAGEEEWMKVVASTQRDHVILCGLGHLGFRVLEQLVASGVDVVAIERNGQGRFVPHSKALGIAVLVRDMKEDQALIDAGVRHARAIIIATNDDMANLEVAVDSRRMNPGIRVTMRLFDQQLAAKLSATLLVDTAYSASALAAPYVAALSLATRVMPSAMIGGVPFVTSEITVGDKCPWLGLRFVDIERACALRILGRTSKAGVVDAPPPPDAAAELHDVLVIHCRSADLVRLLHRTRGSMEPPPR